MIFKKKKLLYIYFIFIIVIKSFSEENRNILVLHSYHQGLEWTDSITKGISYVFTNNDRVNIYYEYLDMKRNYGERYYKKLQKLYQHKVKRSNYDAIIVSDNAAFDFILENRENFTKISPLCFVELIILKKIKY